MLNQMPLKPDIKHSEQSITYEKTLHVSGLADGNAVDQTMHSRRVSPSRCHYRGVDRLQHLDAAGDRGRLSGAAAPERGEHTGRRYRAPHGGAAAGGPGLQF